MFVLIFAFIVYGCEDDSKYEGFEDPKEAIPKELLDEMKTFNAKAEEYVTSTYNQLIEKKDTLTKEEFDETVNNLNNFVNEYNNFLKILKEKSPEDYNRLIFREENVLLSIRSFFRSVENILNFGATEEMLGLLKAEYESVINDLKNIEDDLEEDSN